MPRHDDRPRLRGAHRPATLALALTLALPASAADAPKNDPFERLNRATYAFNDALDRMLARPAARAYKRAVPAQARKAVSNFLANLSYPTVIVNDALQGKLRDAGSDTLRFLTNTTIGIGGLFDPASHFGLAAHDEDFGQTLGVWGVPAGPYVVLPFVGPSDLRDAPGRVVDHFTGGDYYLRYTNSDALSSNSTEYGLYGARALDTRTELLSTDEALKQAFDPYALVRNAYLARREYLVRDGNLPEETYDDLPDAPPSGAPPAAPAEPPKAGAETPDAAAPSPAGADAPKGPEPPKEAGAEAAPAAPTGAASEAR